MGNAANRRLPLLLAGLVLSLSATELAFGVDVVILVRNKESRKGTVKRDDANGVELMLARGGTVRFDRVDVLEVQYDEGRPQEYQNGVACYRRGDYQLALSQLESAKDAPHKELLTQYILYYLGLTQAKLKDYPAAIKAFAELAALGSGTRFLSDAYENLITLGLAADEPAQAKKYVYEYVKLTAGGADKLKVTLWKALIEEKQGNWGPARELYRKAAAAGDARVAAKSELGYIRCLKASKRGEEAAKRIRDLVKRPIAKDICAQAYVLLGDILKEKAGSPEDWEEALLAYLRVPLLYGGSEETEPKALYEAAVCYRRTKHKDKDARAETLIKLLKRRYPNSPYAKKPL